ncbi:MAG: Acb2/Tad1 domain-containing protein [Microbacterium gubbeenense]|uniref:Acb2/Tad1 domain-containing protein n=1 Tax=Microbacterium gubbeenense TaxID=159896 RepID=UPI003F98CEE3
MTRFAIAQDGAKPTDEQLADQKLIQKLVAHTAMQLEDRTKPSREQSLALTKLEEALMWAGKAIFKENA